MRKKVKGLRPRVRAAKPAISGRVGTKAVKLAKRGTMKGGGVAKLATATPKRRRRRRVKIA